MKKLYLFFLLPSMFFFTGAIYTPYPNSVLYNPGLDTKIKPDNEDKLHKEFKITEGKSLDINLESGGSINIAGWDKDNVTVDINSPKSDLRRYDFNFKESSDGLTVTSRFKKSESHRNNSLSFSFHIPNKFNVALESMGGAVTIKNVDGEITGKTMGGNLELSELKGRLELKTMGGPINLYDSEVDGSVHTMGGPVTISNVKGDVKGTTNGGPVTLKNVTSRSGKSTWRCCNNFQHGRRNKC